MNVVPAAIVKTTVKVAICFTLVLSFAGESPAPSIIRNGGDPLVYMFEDGRAHALAILREIPATELLSRATTGRAGSWLAENKAHLIADVAASPHEWFAPWPAECPRDVCACTNLGAAAAAVHLRLDKCRAYAPDVLATAALLAHESAHHLGVADEAFAYEIGSSLQRAWRAHVWSPRQLDLRPVQPLRAGRCARLLKSSDAAENHPPIVLGTDTVRGSVQALRGETGAASWAPVGEPFGFAVDPCELNATASASHVGVWGAYGSHGQMYRDGALLDVQVGRWDDLGMQGPVPRRRQALALGSKGLFVWGGQSFSAPDLLPADGGWWSRSQASWQPLARPGAPSGRVNPILIPYDDHLLVTGGQLADGSAVVSGGLYELNHRQWTSIADAPFFCATASGVAQAGEAVILGQECQDLGGTGLEADIVGAVYSSGSDTWRVIPAPFPRAIARGSTVRDGVVYWLGHAAGAPQGTRDSIWAYSLALRRWASLGAVRASVGDWGSARVLGLHVADRTLFLLYQAAAGSIFGYSADLSDE